MAPAGQRFGADDPAAGDRYLRLEQNLDLVLVERAPEIDLELVAYGIIGLSARFQHADRPRFRRLGVGERGTRAAQQSRSILTGQRSRDADPTAKRDDMIAGH